jgi:hypothetical protein
MRLLRGLILLVGVVAIAAVAPTGPAGAEDGRPSEHDLQSIYDEFCGHPGPCRVVNALADPGLSDVRSSTPPPLYRALPEHGRPADDCPAAAKYYGGEGPPVDAFLGPCPQVPPGPSSAEGSR